MVKQNNIPTVESQCPVDKETTREEMKVFIDQLNNKIPNSKKSIEAALDNEDQFNLW
jgi:hypothetical protein